MEKNEVLERLKRIGDVNQRTLAELTGVSTSVIESLRNAGIVRPGRVYGEQGLKFSARDVLRAGHIFV